MKRREFLAAASAASIGSMITGRAGWSVDDHPDPACRTYASPAEAMKAPRETTAYVAALYAGSSREHDYLSTVDVDPDSKTYGRIVHRLEMPHAGDELHHYGWNVCSSCHGEEGKHRRFIVLPGLRSSRIYIVDTQNARSPKIQKVIEPAEVKRRTNLSAPHTVHCLADGTMMISMLGDAQGNAPGGFLLLDENFDIAGRWERSLEGMNYNYDFWYQPRHNVMVSSEWAAPNTNFPGFKIEDVQAGKYGRHIHFWDWKERRIVQSQDLGEQGMIPLEIRFHHNPDSPQGFVGAALSTVMWHFRKTGDAWKAEPVITVPGVEQDGWPFPVPGLMTDLVLSMDDRWLYFSNWLHGDIRQYDVRDPARPRLAGQAWLGGVIGKGQPFRGNKLSGGPQMLQLSLDGKRLYVTNSLFSSWDNQFYPGMAKTGSYMLQLDCDTDRGGLTVNDKFFVDYGAEPKGPARAHEIRFPGGDSTSDIWV